MNILEVIMNTFEYILNTNRIRLNILEYNRIYLNITEYT